jgi:hypothetical protein
MQVCRPACRCAHRQVAGRASEGVGWVGVGWSGAGCSGVGWGRVGWVWGVGESGGGVGERGRGGQKRDEGGHQHVKTTSGFQGPNSSGLFGTRAKIVLILSNTQGSKVDCATNRQVPFRVLFNASSCQLLYTMGFPRKRWLNNKCIIT